MKKRKIIGGFFPLELMEGTEYHQGALRLNSARCALEYLLRIRNYKKVYLPAYICDSVLQPIKRLNIDYAFYRIGENFAPVFDRTQEENACFLYVNYFGLNSDSVRKICRHFKNVIIDETQAFFAAPPAAVDTIYSPRKFFGVPDGGYLYTDCSKRIEVKPDTSYYRCDALLQAIDCGKEAAVPLFVENEAYLDQCGMRAMSRLTRHLLQGIDYERVLARRNSHFHYLHEQIGRFNQLQIDLSEPNGPMCYPLLIDNGEQLKKFLIERNIYVNDYWDEVIARVPSGSFEYRLAKDLVALPVDQQCDLADMEAIAQTVREFLH